MNDTAQLFELDNIRRFKNFWSKCTEEEKQEISNIIKQDLGEEIQITLTAKQLNDQADEVIQFLNRKAGKNFRLVDTHKKHIKARLKSGITVQQLKAIIVVKTREWNGTDQAQYLRPATLFNETNCENYLGGLE